MFKMILNRKAMAIGHLVKETADGEKAGITDLLTPYLLMISLSILGVFEGFAIGA